MAEPIETEVLIIGGGPTGMVAALCLDQLGVDSIILERQAGIKDHPKAHELSGRSIEILRGLGFTYDALSREASPYADACKIVFCDDLSQEYGVIDISKGAGAEAYARALPSPWPFLNISQVELEKVILQRLETRPRIDLRWNQQWESMQEGPDAVLSQVTDRATGESFTIRSRYVLCADGAGSRSRKSLGIEMVGPERLRDFVNVYLEMDLSGVVHTRGKLYFCLNPDIPGVTLIAHHVERRWVLNAPLLGEEAAEAYSDERLVALTRRAIARDDVPIQVRSMSRWRMTAQVAAAFRRGRAILIGDAAHRFPPTGGLGMNSGIGDAQNVCWKLAAVLRGVAPDALLDTYEEERRPVIEANCEFSRRNHEGVLDVIRAFGLDPEQAESLIAALQTGPASLLPQAGQRWLRMAANRYGASLLRRFHTHPEVRESVLRAIEDQRPHFSRIGLELGYRYASGALLSDGTTPDPVGDPVSTYVPSTGPGARFPHFWLDGNRRTRSSHSLLTPGSTTLIVGRAVKIPEDPALTALCARGRVELRRLDDRVVPLACDGLAHARAEINVDGALLIRPDDHVAWRQRSGVTLSAALLASILEQCYGFAEEIA